MACYLVDTAHALTFLLSETQHLPNDPPSFYIDSEGYMLGRRGTIDLLQIYVLPLQETFIIDIFKLKHAATETRFQGNSLRKLLESPSIQKVFFDVRNDADALFSLLGVSLDGVVDLQMMEYFQERRTGRDLASLKRCVEYDGGLAAEDFEEWSQLKSSSIHAAKVGDLDDLPSQRRPLSPNMLQYAAGDVEYLPCLYETYRQRLTNRAWDAVRTETKRRLLETRKPDYDPRGMYLGRPRGMGPYRKPQQTRQRPSQRHTVNKKGADKAISSPAQPAVQKHKDKPAATKGGQGKQTGKSKSVPSNVTGAMSTMPPFSSSENMKRASTWTQLMEQLSDARRHQQPIAFVKEEAATNKPEEKQNKKREKKKKKAPVQSSNKANEARSQYASFSDFGYDDDQNGSNGGRSQPSPVRHFGYDEDDQDWSLCDKDCGWCGHCCDNIYVW